MALGVLVRERQKGRRAPRGVRRWALVALALGSASCVPVTASQAPRLAAPLTAPPAIAERTTVTLPEAAPVTAAASLVPLPAAPALAAPYVYQGRTPLDRLRALDCLAQAIYYEAGRESENGQRAVAQVVLNRVRHPAWPDSVCGVVYQGPMRVGGGCQFTFTCDGSLLSRPSGEAWARARRLAGEALAGYVFAPVGVSTHYHANYVYPTWAPTLRGVTVIGAHLFYRLPGARGDAAAFTDAYVGVEPFPHPAFTMLRRPSPRTGLAGMSGFNRASSAHAALSYTPGAAQVPQEPPSMAEAMVREEYRSSGQWRSDAPESIRGQ
jgi:hypothetical protein